MKILFRLLSLGATLLTAACSQAGVVAANLPTHFDDVRVSRDVAFGAEDWAKMDIYAPAQPSSKPRDVIVFYYGGRWEFGSKKDYRFVGSALAKRDFIVVIPDYRKYPAVKFPAFVEDGARSLAWVSDHIGAYGGDPARIHIAGHSAGAHIAALLATDSHYLKDVGKDRSKVIRSFVGLAGPYAFKPDEKDLIDMFGPPDRYPLMQASTFIDGRQPPMLLLWGDKDQYVGKINIDRMLAAAHEKGGCIRTKTYPGVEHIWILAGMSWLGKNQNLVAGDMTDFMRKIDAAPDNCLK